jgi:osmotically-inducible protein OsmY
MRSSVRALVVTLVALMLGFLLIGYFGGLSAQRRLALPGSVASPEAVERARERGAELGEKAAIATAKVEETLGDAALTTKIKAKMALDDSVEARAIDVSTHDAVVTLRGTVRSAAERERSVSLARETAGVMRVVDNLEMR